MLIYFAVGFSLSLTNLSAPISCLSQLFCLPKASEILQTEQELAKEGKQSEVPQTVAEMRKLIAELKEK